MAALVVTFLTVHGSDAHQEPLPFNVLMDTIFIQLPITAPFAAVFTLHGSTAPAVQLLLHAQLDTLLMETITAAFAVAFTPHGKLAQVTLNLLHVTPPTMSIMLKQTVLLAQQSQEALSKLATQPPITLLAPLALIF